MCVCVCSLADHHGKQQLLLSALIIIKINITLHLTVWLHIYIHYNKPAVMLCTNG